MAHPKTGLTGWEEVAVDRYSRNGFYTRGKLVGAWREKLKVKPDHTQNAYDR